MCFPPEEWSLSVFKPDNQDWSSSRPTRARAETWGTTAGTCDASRDHGGTPAPTGRPLRGPSRPVPSQTEPEAPQPPSAGSQPGTAPGSPPCQSARSRPTARRPRPLRLPSAPAASSGPAACPQPRSRCRGSAPRPSQSGWPPSGRGARQVAKAGRLRGRAGRAGLGAAGLWGEAGGSRGAARASRGPPPALPGRALRRRWGRPSEAERSARRGQPRLVVLKMFVFCFFAFFFSETQTSSRQRGGPAEPLSAPQAAGGR